MSILQSRVRRLEERLRPALPNVATCILAPCPAAADRRLSEMIEDGRH